METEFETKIGNLIIRLETSCAVTPHRLGMIGIIGRKNAVVIRQKYLILGRPQQQGFIDALEKRFRIMSHRSPQAGIQPGKQRACRAVPTVPEVIGQFFQAREPGGNFGIDRNSECSTCSHRYFFLADGIDVIRELNKSSASKTCWKPVDLERS